MLKSLLISYPKRYILIFFAALFLRLIYAFYFQKFMWGDYKFVHPDTYTYLNAFINLIEYGRYCFDLQVEDSCFYRMPTYPFFLGVNYWAFGTASWASISILQAIIDAGSCCLAVAICNNLGLRIQAQKIAALLFIFYPFTIVWVPQQNAEILGVFFVIFAVYLIVTVRNSVLSVVAGGAILVLAVWSKQYVAAILPAVIFFVAARNFVKNYVQILIGISISFCIFYSPWVLRNIINYDRPIFLMGETTGSMYYLGDYSAAMKFIGLFYENQINALDSIVNNGVLNLPDSLFVDKHRGEIDRIAKLAYSCGPSFRTWRREQFEFSTNSRHCEKIVAAGFDNLSHLAKKEMNFLEYYKTSFEAFQKGFLKTNYQEKSGGLFLQSILFGYRAILISLGILAIFVVRERRLFYFVFGAQIFWVTTLYVLAFSFRHVEMRYLLMSDMLLLICAMITFDYFLKMRSK